MKRAHYRCNGCGHEFAAVMDDSARVPDRYRCGEGGCKGTVGYWLVRYDVPVEEPLPAAAPTGFVKNRPYEFDRRYAVMPQGRHHGVSDARYKAHHRRWQNEAAKEQREVDRGFAKGKSNVPRYIGGMSGEMVRAIGLQEGDPEAVSRDPEAFLKKTGRYVGE